MYKKLSLLFLTGIGISSLQAMEVAPAKQAQHVPQAACPHPVYLINNSDENLDITITTTPNIVTEQNAYVLKAIIAGLTVPLPCDNLEEITDKALVSKFKRAKFQFTIKPHDNLLLPGIATGQKITVWKKRMHLDVVAYELPIQKIEDIAKNAQQDKTAIVKVFITPAPSYGFDFQYCLAQQENHNFNPQLQEDVLLPAEAIEFPVCHYPVKLVNKSTEPLDVTLVAQPSGLVTRNGKFLQLVLVSLTASLNLADLNGIMAHNIQDKFKKAEFDFTINPEDTLMLSGIAPEQKIIAWKKRMLLPLIPYELPLTQIEQATRYSKLGDNIKNVAYMFIEPATFYGFNTQVSIIQE